MTQSTPRPAASKQTTVLLTPEVDSKMTELSTATYGMRGGPRWIEEALREFIELPDFVTRIGAGEAGISFTKARVIRLTKVAEHYLVQAVKGYRKIEPEAESVRASALRAAFLHKIRNSQPLESEADLQAEGLADKPASLRARRSA